MSTAIIKWVMTEGTDMALSDKDVERICDALAQRMDEESKKLNLTIDPLTHYEEHIALRRMMEFLDEDTLKGLKRLAGAFDEGMVQNIKTIFKYRTTKWVFIVVTAFFVGLGFFIYAILHPTAMLKSLLP